MTFSTRRSFVVGDAGVVVPDRHGRSDKGLPDGIGSEFLQRRVGIHSLVVGVAIEKRRGFVGHHLLQDRGNRFALGKPLPSDLGQQPRCIGFVEHDRAGRPAIGEGETVELVQNPGRGDGGKADDCQHSQMRMTQASVRGRRSTAGRPAPRRDTSGFLGRERADVWSRRSNAGRSASPRHRAIRVSGMKPSISPSTRSVRSTNPRWTCRASLSCCRSRPS